MESSHRKRYIADQASLEWRAGEVLQWVKEGSLKLRTERARCHWQRPVPRMWRSNRGGPRERLLIPRGSSGMQILARMNAIERGLE